jgi:gas vesicle protein
MSDNNDLGAFLAGFVIGGLVGAATALILAPQSGEETRSQIVNQSLALRDAGEAACPSLSGHG